MPPADWTNVRLPTVCSVVNSFSAENLSAGLLQGKRGGITEQPLTMMMMMTMMMMISEYGKHYGGRETILFLLEEH